MEPLYSDNFFYLGLIVLMPLLGAIINGLFGARMPRKLVDWIACGAMLVSFMFALISVRGLIANATVVGDRTVYGHLAYTVYEWIFSGNLGAEIAFMLDPLSAVLVLIITGVGFLIHVYSTAYMAEDPAKWKYFTYLNLFVFAMLLLVLGKNMLVTFIGWEGVGACSYLLIGFWYDDASKAAAGQKAFIVNRVGDFAFLLGMFILFYATGTVDYVALGELATSAATIAKLAPLALPVGLLIFVGCTGKSAQLPLYVWLPDAMAGPTPVSALIHAATMVTAGVFLISRMNWLFTIDPRLMLVVAVVGCLTALFAASMAIVQTDIKKVLAYSTVSQLGYMFMAVGVGAFTAAVFHLMTHAFFKALLFLGSGSVIHGMHHEQDIRKMGGLKHYMPMTRITFLIGTIAIAGVPFFSGFFSKDLILWNVLANVHLYNIVGALDSPSLELLTTVKSELLASGEAVQVVPYANVIHWGLFILGLVTAGMTAFYMFRLYFLTFEGECRADEETRSHIHESPQPMTIALTVLAILSIIGGYVGVPHFAVHVLPESLQGVALGLEHWLSEVFYVSEEYRLTGRFGAHPYAQEAIAAGVSILVAFSGIGLAFLMYVKNPGLPAEIAERTRALYRTLSNKYYVDEAYQAAFVTPTLGLGKAMYWFDRYVIDGVMVNGLGFVASSGGRVLRHLQSGNLQRYATYIVLVIVLMLFALWAPR